MLRNHPDLLTRARYVADIAIRDGENWRDRRLPECGRVINELADRLAAAETALRKIAEFNYLQNYEYAFTLPEIAREYLASVEGGQERCPANGELCSEVGPCLWDECPARQQEGDNNG